MVICYSLSKNSIETHQPEINNYLLQPCSVFRITIRILWLDILKA